MTNSGKIDFEIGYFQKNIIEAKIVELLLKKFTVNKMLYLILNNYCECQKMTLSKI